MKANRRLYAIACEYTPCIDLGECLFLGIRQASELLGVYPNTLYRRIHNKTIDFIKVNGKPMIPEYYVYDKYKMKKRNIQYIFYTQRSGYINVAIPELVGQVFEYFTEEHNLEGHFTITLKKKEATLSYPSIEIFEDDIYRVIFLDGNNPSVCIYKNSLANNFCSKIDSSKLKCKLMNDIIKKRSFHGSLFKYLHKKVFK